MSPEVFRTDAEITTAAPRLHAGCGCAGCGLRHPSRRLFTGALLTGALLPAMAQGVREEVGSESAFSKLVPAEDVEAAATQQYRQLLSEAARQRALAPENHPQLQRLRYIAQRIIPFTNDWNPRARQWKWEVNLIGSKELNAFCMPGGKIAFFYGILQQLQLSDDEVATIMGHETAHALREHARERMGKSAATQLGAGAISALLGLGNLGNQVLGMGSQLLTLKFSREDETEADLVGIELAARSGYDPAAAVRLWEKMMTASKGAPPQWLSTHPTNTTRIRDIQSNLPKVEGLYARASKPSQRFPEAPPLKSRQQ